MLLTLLGGTSVLSIISAVKYRKENKKLKQLEVKKSHAEAQRQEIDLADMYKDKVLELLEQVSEKQDGGNANQAKMLDKLDTLDSRMDKVEAKVSDIVLYLNGGFQDFVKQQQHQPEAAKTRTRKPRKKAE